MNRRGPTVKYAAPAAGKAFEILHLLGDHNSGLTVSEMSIALGRSVGELYRIVVDMERQGFLKKSTVNDRYSVTYKLLEMILRATPAQNLVQAAVPEMQSLTRDIEQSCHLAVENGPRGLIVAREEGPGTRGFALRVGGSIDLLSSCSGQVIIAFSKPEAAEHIIEHAQPDRERPVDMAAFEKQLKRVRKQGYNLRKSPITFGVTDISYPLFGFTGEIVGALTIPFLALVDGSQKVDLNAARERLDVAAKRISDQLGFLDPSLQIEAAPSGNNQEG